MFNVSYSEPAVTTSHNKFFTLQTFQLDIHITGKCNLDCRYCVENKSNNSKDDMPESLFLKVLEFIDFLMDSDIFKLHFKYLVIHFWGGEPTLADDYIRRIYYKYKEDERVIFLMTSNIISLHKIIDILHDDKISYNKFQIIVSYDGRTVTNKNRVTCSGKPITEDVLNILEELYQKGFYNFIIRSVMTPDSIEHLYEIYTEFKELRDKYPKMSRIHYHPVFEHYWDKNRKIDYKKLENDLINIVYDEFERYKNSKSIVFFSYFNIYAKRLKPCFSGAAFFHISNKGNFYRCFLAQVFDNINGSNVITNINKDFNNIISDLKHEQIKNMGLLQLKQPRHCSKCLIPLCTACPVVNFTWSKKEKFEDRYFDYHNDPIYCKIHNYIARAGFILRMLIEEYKFINHNVKNTITRLK